MTGGAGRRIWGTALRVVAVSVLASGLGVAPVLAQGLESDFKTNLMCGSLFDARGELPHQTERAYDTARALSEDPEAFEQLWEESYRDWRHDLMRQAGVYQHCRDLFAPRREEPPEVEVFAIPDHLAHITYERALECGTQFDIINLYHPRVLAYRIAEELATDGDDLEADKSAAMDHWLFQASQDALFESIEACRAEFETP